MKERPILFNAEMVNAILSGRKTQTRRVMKDQPTDCFSPMNMGLELDYTARWYTPGIVDKHGYLQPAKKEIFGVADEHEGYECPMGAVCDQLWVRETWQGPLVDYDEAYSMFKDPKPYQKVENCVYRADGGPCPEFTDADDDLRQGWRPSIHMPRWASRINLLITGVRVERLNDISQEDAKSEGCCYGRGGGVPDLAVSPADHFPTLWESIYGVKSWAANPWVWVIEFERVAPAGEQP